MSVNMMPKGTANLCVGDADKDTLLICSNSLVYVFLIFLCNLLSVLCFLDQGMKNSLQIQCFTQVVFGVSLA